MVTAEDENAREIWRYSFSGGFMNIDWSSLTDPKRAEAVICRLEGASSDGRALRNASLEEEAKGDPM